MSHNVPDPWLEPLDDFDVLMSQNKVPYLTPLEALFDEAEEQLRAERPEGFNVEQIGQLAFSKLPESEKAEALEELLYVFWAARDSDRKAIAQHEAQGGAR